MSVFLEIEMTQGDMDAMVISELENLLDDERLSKEEKRVMKRAIRILDFYGVCRGE